MSDTRDVQMGDDCALHRHREWVPLEKHHVWPLGMGGPDSTANISRICRNGHGSVHALMDWLIRTQGVVPWRIERRFGRKVRRMAKLGYERMLRGAM